MSLVSYSIAAEKKALTTMISSRSTESRMMMRSISWLSPSMLLRNLGGVDLEMGMGIRMVLGIWDWEWKREEGTMLLQKSVYGSTNIPAVGESSLLCNPVRMTPTHTLSPHIHNLHSLPTAKNQTFCQAKLHHYTQTTDYREHYQLRAHYCWAWGGLFWVRCSFSIFSSCSYDFCNL